ncbi:MAG TPA: HNH endonuclease [Chloroflexota bacterium]|nr:HNH endonuclease [Chloroflexota bacterium]
MVGENSLAHRLAWKFTYGELPDDLWVLHQCDNPLCQRPDHLFLGKSLDNIQDKVAKGRQARGESQGLSKLTEADVREIRRLHAAGGLFRRPLAERFGVSEVQIGLIVRRLAWRHVD